MISSPVVDPRRFDEFISPSSASVARCIHSFVLTTEFALDIRHTKAVRASAAVGGSYRKMRRPSCARPSDPGIDREITNLENCHA